MKNINWRGKDNTADNVCELCGKKTDDTIRVKIEVKGVGIVCNVCDDCVKKNGYVEYDGSDYISDWN